MGTFSEHISVSWVTCKSENGFTFPICHGISMQVKTSYLQPKRMLDSCNVSALGLQHPLSKSAGAFEDAAPYQENANVSFSLLDSCVSLETEPTHWAQYEGKSDWNTRMKQVSVNSMHVGRTAKLKWIWLSVLFEGALSLRSRINHITLQDKIPNIVCHSGLSKCQYIQSQDQTWSASAKITARLRSFFRGKRWVGHFLMKRQDSSNGPMLKH